MDRRLLHLEFKNGYCVTVFSQERFTMPYYVQLFHKDEPQDTHRVDFNNERAVFGYLADVQNAKKPRP